MDSVVEYRRRGAITHSFDDSGSGGGSVDDIFRRLGNVEKDVSESRAEIRAISAVIPHLATAASVFALRSEVAAILAIIPHLATKADLKAEISDVRGEIADVRGEIADVKTAVAEVRTEVASMETKIIKWIIGTVLSSTGLAFTVAKFVH
jgi:chromosome segregation ATPase